VKLRGEVIGSVDVRSPENRQWDQDELDIVTAIIERSAIAMENARLLVESQKLATKERTIGEISRGSAHKAMWMNCSRPLHKNSDARCREWKFRFNLGRMRLNDPKIL